MSELRVYFIFRNIIGLTKSIQLIIQELFVTKFVNTNYFLVQN